MNLSRNFQTETDLDEFVLSKHKKVKKVFLELRFETIFSVCYSDIVPLGHGDHSASELFTFLVVSKCVLLS